MLNLSGFPVCQYGPPSNRGSGSVILILATVIIVLALIAMFILLFPRLKNVKPSKSIEPEVKRIEKADEDDGGVDPLEITLRLLNDEEKRVVKALDEAGGSMLQKDISYDLGLSRVKAHRTIAKLIEMDVVTAEKYFNTNRITLADWLRTGKLNESGSSIPRDEEN